MTPTPSKLVRKQKDKTNCAYNISYYGFRFILISLFLLIPILQILLSLENSNSSSAADVASTGSSKFSKALLFIQKRIRGNDAAYSVDNRQPTSTAALPSLSVSSTSNSFRQITPSIPVQHIHNPLTASSVSSQRIPSIPVLPFPAKETTQQMQPYSVSSYSVSPPPPQPETWTAVTDKKTKKVYWWNRSTGETTRVGVPRPQPQLQPLVGSSSTGIAGLGITPGSSNDNTNSIGPSIPSIPTISTKYQPQQQRRLKRALIFTMDSIDSYVANSRSGGPGGEILVRESLQRAFEKLNVKYDVIKSDHDADHIAMTSSGYYDFLIMDPWTWATKGWVPKPFLVGHEEKVFILDFFGSESLKGNHFYIPPTRFLTAFGGYPSNPFLGFSISLDFNSANEFSMRTKRNQGVIWGKSNKYLSEHTDLLAQLADHVELHSTCSSAVFKHPNVHWHGTLREKEWKALLMESKFLLGIHTPYLIYIILRILSISYSVSHLYHTPYLIYIILRISSISYSVSYLYHTPYLIYTILRIPYTRYY